MKKIAYIEIDTHAEIAGNFLELMENSKVFSVDYFFSQKILNQINCSGAHVFEVSHSTLFSQLRKTKYDFVLIGTVHRYFNLFRKITAEYNTSIIVHNLNFTEISRTQLFVNIFKRDFKYRLKLFLTEGLLSAPSVFKNARNLLVLDNSTGNSKFKFLPVFFLSPYEKVRNSVITVVIPGTVSQERRDYLHIFKSIKGFQQSTPIQFVFLGKAQRKELLWLKEFEKSRPQKISLKYFTQKVPQSIFDDFMMRADILWCPIQGETEFFSNRETYGKTKMTGNIGDAIRYGKLALFPEDYPNNHAFIIREDKNIEEQIYSCRNLPEFDFPQNFGKENVLRNLEEQLKTLF